MSLIKFLIKRKPNRFDDQNRHVIEEFNYTCNLLEYYIARDKTRSEEKVETNSLRPYYEDKLANPAAMYPIT
jgi:hypothetical protein